MCVCVCVYIYIYIYVLPCKSKYINLSVLEKNIQTISMHETADQ